MRILLTAFEPYDQWDSNSSWEAMMELLRVRGTIPGVTTRRYPVDLVQLESRLRSDLKRRYDAVLHLGQSPGLALIHLEAIAINIAGITNAAGDEFEPLVPEAPVAFRSQLPLGEWAIFLRKSGIPAAVSYHAGTYLCNAAMYLSHYFLDLEKIKTKVGFVHLPLTNEQVLVSNRSLASLPVGTSAQAIGILIDQLQATVGNQNIA